MAVQRIERESLLGLFDKVVGLSKEIVGTLAGQENLAKAGRVQQQKGTERLKAVKAEVEAEAHDAKAAAAEKSQKVAQKVKETVNN